MMTIPEGNKLIAEFMGAVDETGYMQASTIGKTKVPTGRMWMKERFPNNMHLCSKSDLEYHSSWDWLRPVVDKIFEYSIAYPEQAKKVCDMKIVANIDAAWRKVVEFITWFNAIK